MAPSKHRYLGSPPVPCAHLLLRWPSGWSPWAPQEPLGKERRPREQWVMKASAKRLQGQAGQGRGEGAGKDVPRGAAHPASRTSPQDIGVPSRDPAQEGLQSVLVLVGKVTPSVTGCCNQRAANPEGLWLWTVVPTQEECSSHGMAETEGAGLRRSIEIPHAYTTPHTSPHTHAYTCSYTNPHTYRHRHTHIHSTHSHTNSLFSKHGRTSSEKETAAPGKEGCSAKVHLEFPILGTHEVGTERSWGIWQTRNDVHKLNSHFFS